MLKIRVVYTNILFDQEINIMQIIQHEVIDIDMDEDSDDVMLIDEKIDTYNKRKVIQMFMVFTSVIKVFILLPIKYPF